jgi:mRNA (guanine-N7-)-methyltransferase
MQTSAPQFRGVLNSICEILPKLLIDNPEQCSLLELYGETGEHQGKFARLKISNYGSIETNEQNLTNVKKKWFERTKNEGTFLCIDLSTSACNDLNLLLFDHMVCYSAKFEHQFENEEKARTFLNNCARLIRPGGYFFGYLLDSSQAWTLFQKEIAKRDTKRSSIQIKKGVYTLTVYNLEDSNFSTFGTGYELAIEGEPVKRSGYMIQFSSFIQLAKAAGFKVISTDNMQQFFEDYKEIYHEIFKSYLVYRKYKTINQNDASLISMFSIFILQRVTEDV